MPGDNDKLKNEKLEGILPSGGILSKLFNRKKI